MLALEQQREEIETQHLQMLRGTYQQGTLAYATVQRQIEELASQSALRRQEIEREVNQRHADYRHTFEQIGSSITSSVMGMIQGHQTLGQAAKKVASSIVQSFIAARVKIVADWLAGLATQTAATVTAQTTQTAAVAAGAGARTGLEQTAAAASNTAAIGSVMKSIMASAGETFAGIFGFLSPVMGPAAAGPAAAGQAAVMAVAGSFAVGSWELPNDMIAQVHKGEMIVPAAKHPWAQNLMANSAGGGGQGGGDIHVHHSTDINVSAMDAHSIRQFFKDNSKRIMRTISEGVRTGAHIGLSKLRGLSDVWNVKSPFIFTGGGSR